MESASSDDEDVVEQSLMQLENESGDDEEEGDLHILMLAPDLLDHDATMDSVLFFPSSSTAVNPDQASGLPAEEEKFCSPMSTKAEISSSDVVQENTSMNIPVVSVPPFKEEEKPLLS